ncbi:MAG: adenylyl-sulfate kinase [Chromatium okenii]|nr:adenylyl-sulfate kinase [Chromatium okenii]MBV5310997.1 adenylyl-sulfate kinase [Chromatium okenii]
MNKVVDCQERRISQSCTINYGDFQLIFPIGQLMTTDIHLTWHTHQVTRAHREAQNGHKGCVIWFTGLSGSGKSTIANTLDHQLYARGIRSTVLDGDNVRHSLNAAPAQLLPIHGVAFAERFGLGFSAIDREENIRRIGAVAQLFAEAGMIALTAFISPYRRDRELVRNVLQPSEFIEVFVNTPLAICETRDPKGLYKKARAGELKGFTGIDDPYEAPLAPELTLNADNHTPEMLAETVIIYLQTQGIIAA